MVESLSFRDLSDSLADARVLTKWANDPEIRYLFRVFPTEESHAHLYTPEEILAEKTPSNHRERRLVIEWDGQMVGEMSFGFALPHMIHQAPDVAWFSIVLGEPEARGRGIGRLAMLHLEQEAQRAGARKVEIGVFEFNARALGLYQSLGYKEIARPPAFTYWNGRKWSDVRMLKDFGAVDLA